MFRLLALTLLLLVSVTAHAARALQVVSDDSQRYALVIGNNAYQAVEPLEKAVNDARAMARALEQAGFKTTLLTNATEKRMNSSVNEFVDHISGGGVGVLFFAGHGIQINNQNYLLPVDMEAPRRESDVEDQAVSLQGLQEKIAQAKAKFALVVVDACRNNPLPRKAGRSLGGTRGLTQPTAPNGQMVIYSAGANETALDKLHPTDRDPNGLFTREFLPVLGQPGLSVGDALKQVRRNVIAKAKGVNHDQHPALYDQTDGEFYLVPGAAVADPVRPVTVTPPVQRPVVTAPNVDPVEEDYWKEVSKADDADSYAAYLSAYPNGAYVADAREWLDKDKRNKETKAKLKEDQAWSKAQEGNSYASFSAYLKAYPNGRYVALAKLKQKKLGGGAQDCPDCPEMVVIPGKDYAMGRFEVTVGQFAAFVNDTGHDMGNKCWTYEGTWEERSGRNWRNLGFSQGDTDPVACVNWNDAQAYVQWLSRKTGKPTESEWKHACDGGNSQEYCGSGNVDAVAWYDGNSGNRTHPVGQKQANGYGLHDMSGNVREWQQDCWELDCSRRVLRGGSWHYDSGSTRAAGRGRNPSAERSYSTGFRVVVGSARTD